MTKTLAEYRAALGCKDCGEADHGSLGEQATTRDAYLYVAAAKGYEVYKIGITKDVDSRLASLQTGSHAKLQARIVYGTHPNGVPAKDLEYAVHQLLADSRISGEWFRCSSAIIERAIKECFIKLYCPPLYARWQRYRMWASSRNLRKKQCPCCQAFLHGDNQKKPLAASAAM